MSLPLSVIHGDPDALLKFMQLVLGVNPLVGDNELHVWGGLPIKVSTSLSDSVVTTAANSKLAAGDATALLTKIHSLKNFTK